jgi:microcystin-dependent protein
MSELDFQKIFASGASSQIDWTDDNYLKGWGYLGNVPPSYQSFDSLQRLNDLKFKYLYDEFMGIETNTEELISNHNENSEAHKTLFDKKLDKNGGTVTGNLNASGYNITATKFIGNLQGKADSAANADLAAKATTAENANNANNSSVANKLGTSTVGSATKPVYINNGVASAVSIDLSTLAPKASPGLTGTPTAPTANVDTNNTQIATCGFVRNAIAKFAPMLDTMKKIYPVGSIYISTVSTNPATLFGFGTWEAMPAGRVLLAQGKSDWGTTYNAGSTGGEATHQLTVGELPKHKPNISMNTINLVGNGYNALLDNASSNGIITVSTGNASGGGVDVGPKKNFAINASHSHTLTISDVGSNQAHNNIQPYLTVYMWKRIS